MARGGRYGAPAGYGPGSGGSDDDSGGGGGSDDDEPDGPGGGVDLGGIGGGGGGGGSDDDSGSDSFGDPFDSGGGGGRDFGGGGGGRDFGGGGGGDDDSGGGGGRDPSDPTDAPSATPDPGAAEQGLEAGGAAERVVDAATGLEQNVIDRFPSLDGSDVRVEREGDRLTAELTERGRAAFVDERTDGRDPSNRADAPSASGPMPSGDAGASITIPGVDDPAAGTGSSGSGPQGSTGQDGRSLGMSGGDARLFNEERELRREAAAQEEQFGDIPVDSPVSDNRLEEDLETGAEEFRDLVAGLGATTSTVGAPVAATGQLPRPGQADDADLEGLDSQVFESAGEAFNPFGIAAGAKEVAEFGLTQPQRIAEGPEERGEFRDDVEQRAGRIAASTTERASQNPVEFGVGTALGLGFGAVGGGAAASASRRLSGGRIDLGSDLSGRALERAGSGARRFLDDDRAQADLSGFGRGDGGDGSGSGSGSGSAAGGDGPTDLEDFLDEDAEQIAEVDDATSQRFDQITFEAERRAAETRNEADLEDVARDPGPQTVDNRRGGRGVTTRDARTASRDRAPLGQGGTTGRTFGSDATDPDLSPLESQLAAQLNTPDVDLRRRADADSDSGTVSNALARRRDAEEPFALGGGLGAGATGVGGLFGTDTNPATGVDSQVGAGVFGGADADSFADTFVASDARADLDSRLDADTRLDLDTRTDTDTRTDFDSRFDTRFDTRQDTRIDTRQDTRIDTRTDTDTRFDTRQDFGFGDDDDRDDDFALFGTRSRSDTVDSGIQSGSEAAAELFGGGDRDDDPFSL